MPTILFTNGLSYRIPFDPRTLADLYQHGGPLIEQVLLDHDLTEKERTGQLHEIWAELQKRRWGDDPYKTYPNRFEYRGMRGSPPMIDDQTGYLKPVPGGDLSSNFRSVHPDPNIYYRMPSLKSYARKGDPFGFASNPAVPEDDYLREILMKRLEEKTRLIET